MELVHYSKDLNFTPKAKETVADFGKGCFFYPVDAANEWTNRNAFYFVIENKYVEMVQEFYAGEFNPPLEHNVVEVFVRARHLKYLKPI